MKFFKHFTDAHEGKSLTALMNEFGLEGYAAYFILMEMCAKKLEKSGDTQLTEDQCRFTFNERTLREKLRMRSTKVELFLNSCATLVLLQFTKVKDEFNFYVPKLLECLDRDAKRARAERGQPAPKRESKKKREEREGGALESFEKLFESIPLVTQNSIRSTYSEEFINEHGPMCVAYFSARDPQSQSWNGTFWGIKLADWLARERKGLTKKQTSETGGYAERDGVA